MIQKVSLSLSAVVLCVVFIAPTTLGSDLVRDHVLPSRTLAGSVGGQYTKACCCRQPRQPSITVELFAT
jgi:hypothetical protein